MKIAKSKKIISFLLIISVGFLVFAPVFNNFARATDVFYLNKEYILDPIFDALATVLVQALSNSMLNWAKHGFKGKPLFVTNWKGYLNQALSEAQSVGTSQSLQQIANSQYDPKTKALLSQLVTQSVNNPASLFNLNNPSLLINQYSKYNPNLKLLDDFYNNFSHGGWDAWNQLLQPQQNIFGQYLAKVDNINSEAAKAREAAKSEASGPGFLGQRLVGALSKQYISNVTLECYQDKITCTKASGGNSSKCEVDTTGLCQVPEADSLITAPPSLTAGLVAKAGFSCPSRLATSDEISEVLRFIACLVFDSTVKGGLIGAASGFK